jgi:SSS family solute:Na+ symporter
MLLGAFVSWKMNSIKQGWQYISQIGIGIGLVIMLRWYWWRINAWSEISAMASGLILASILPFISLPGVGSLSGEKLFAIRLFIIFMISTPIWIIVTLLTRPDDEEKLNNFYKLVRPGGWWGPVAKRNPEVIQNRAGIGIIGCITGTISLFSSLIGIGMLCVGRYISGLALICICII